MAAGRAESQLGGLAGASLLRSAEPEAWQWTPRPGGQTAAWPRPAVEEVPRESQRGRDPVSLFPAAGAEVLPDGRGQRPVSAFPSAIPAAPPWAAREAAPAAADDRPRVAAAERAASGRLAGAVVAEAPDVQPEAAAGPSAARAAGRWAAEAARDGARRRAAVAAPDVAWREVAEAPDVALREVGAVRPSPAAAVASALPSAAASACRRDRVLPVAPGPRQWARPRRAMRSLQIASPLAQSWQAAGDEVWSCDVGSRNRRKRKRGDQQIRVRPQCGGTGGRTPIYFRQGRARAGTRS